MTRLLYENLSEVVSEKETLVSALVDGESLLPTEGLDSEIGFVHQYFHYQLIRQTLRGVVMTSGAHETIAWSQSRFSRLWARVDAAESGQNA